MRIEMRSGASLASPEGTTAGTEAGERWQDFRSRSFLGGPTVLTLAGRNLRDFGGLGRTNLVARAAMVIFMISLVGMPPLAGFVGKFLLFGVAIDAGFT